jgi:chromatin modification-related protein VID21
MKRSYTPPNSYSVPDWIPIDNYRPATAPISPAAKIPPMPLTSGYTLTLPRLPPEPPHPAKRHRRSSKADERDRASLYRLQVQYGLNPLSDALARSTKVVLTQDWKIAQAELRHIRAMERIEAKKNDGRWSLRQPKKLRGPPIPKGHWDYLLEEMVRRTSNSPYPRTHPFVR